VPSPQVRHTLALVSEYLRARWVSRGGGAFLILSLFLRALGYVPARHSEQTDRPVELA
jgi:hypothetical protein